MTDQTYNGWTNRETWAVKLHLDKEPYTYNACREKAREALTDQYPAGALCMWLEPFAKEYIEETNHHEDCSPQGLLASDLLYAAIGAVNWGEIARHMIDEAREDAECQAACA